MNRTLAFAFATASLIAACKSDVKPHEEPTAKPVEPVAAPIAPPAAKPVEPPPAANPGEPPTAGMMDSEIAARDGMKVEELPWNAIALRALKAFAKSPDAVLDASVTFAFSDYAKRPPTTKDFCGLGASKDGLVISAKLDELRPRVAKALAAKAISCSSADPAEEAHDRVTCGFTDPGDVKYAFVIGVMGDKPRLIGLGQSKLDITTDEGLALAGQYTKALQTKGDAPCTN